MTSVRTAFIWIVAATLVVWLSAELPLWVGGSATRRLGDAFMQGTGVLAIVLMSLSLMLAARPRIVERWLNGLDKMYRLHKWLGIANLVVAAVHWQAYGFVRTGRPDTGSEPSAVAAVDGWAGFADSQHDTAVFIGDQAWKLVLILSILALVKRFPYRLFFKTHWLFVPTYLVLIYHAVILLEVGAWTSLLGPALALVMAAGAWSGFVCLWRSFRFTDDRALGNIVGITYHETVRSLELEVQLDSRWKGHEAGQFAFLSTGDDSPHPFTIISAWRGDGRVSFLIKELGDYTGTLSERLKVGDEVRVEGPWGKFDFASAAPHQIWIAGGVGITPFIARMRHLEQQPDDRPVDFFFSAPRSYPEGDRLLERNARVARVALHLHFSDEEGLITAEHVAAKVPDLANADVWFCGPSAMGAALKPGLVKLGLPPMRFHQELFEMR